LRHTVRVYQQTDRPDLARQAAERLIAVRPTFTVARGLKTRFRKDKTQLEFEANALRAAGLPDP
jgi:hypothetical protein